MDLGAADGGPDGCFVLGCDLYGLLLGATAGKQITIDATAVGWGWTINGGQIDLITAVLHELGHVLGLEHGDDDEGLMGETLAAGESHGAPEWSPNVTASGGGTVEPNETFVVNLTSISGGQAVVTISNDDGVLRAGTLRRRRPCRRRGSRAAPTRSADPLPRLPASRGLGGAGEEGRQGQGEGQAEGQGRTDGQALPAGRGLLTRRHALVFRR